VSAGFENGPMNERTGFKNGPMNVPFRLKNRPMNVLCPCIKRFKKWPMNVLRLKKRPMNVPVS
jgi:hypothetical protein